MVVLWHWDRGERGRLTLNLRWEPRDLWVGVYVHGGYWEMGRRWVRVYICGVPCLPLQLDWRVR